MKRVAATFGIATGTLLFYGLLSFFKVTSTQYELVSTTLVFGSLVTLIWYTIETNLMQEAVRAQAEAASLQIRTSVRPLLAVETKDHGETLAVTNVGNGTALNIKFDRTVLNEELGIYLEYPGILFLRAGDSSTVDIKSFTGGRQSNNSMSMGAHLSSQYGSARHEVRAEYEDVLRTKLVQQFELGKGGPVVGKSGT